MPLLLRVSVAGRSGVGRGLSCRSFLLVSVAGRNGVGRGRSCDPAGMAHNGHVACIIPTDHERGTEKHCAPVSQPEVRSCTSVLASTATSAPLTEFAAPAAATTPMGVIGTGPFTGRSAKPTSRCLLCFHDGTCRHQEEGLFICLDDATVLHQYHLDDLGTVFFWDSQYSGPDGTRIGKSNLLDAKAKQRRINQSAPTPALLRSLYRQAACDGVGGGPRPPHPYPTRPRHPPTPWRTTAERPPTGSREGSSTL